MTKEVLRCLDYRRTPLTRLTEEEIIVLTSLGSVAFGEPMGDSLTQAWLQRKEQMVYRCQAENVSGYLIVDNTWRAEGIYYIELVVVYPPGTGMGTALHEATFKDIISTVGGTKTVLVVTQNPDEITAFGKAANRVGYSYFPVDRPPSAGERKAINTWLSIGPMRNLKLRPVIDLDLCVLHDTFRNWQPQIDRHVQEGKFSKFLLVNDINFSEFCDQRNAFVVGCSL